MNKTIAAVCLGFVSTMAFAAKPAATAKPAMPACDRECLRGMVTQVLHALVEHDISKLPVADNLRVTEDAVEKKLDKVALVKSVTLMRGYRQDVIDERAGQAVAGVVLEEVGAPIIVTVRVKVAGEKISELELVATRSRLEGLSFTLDTLVAPSKVMNYAPRPSQLATREQAVDIALHYPKGLNSTETFASVGTPFASDAYRIENGALMAGRNCTFNPGCANIATQSLEIFKRLGRVTVRDVFVDERMGIVMLRMAWNVRGPGSDKLTVWEMFKVYDGEIHAVEAYMRLLPPDLENGGWPIAVAQPQ